MDVHLIEHSFIPPHHCGGGMDFSENPRAGGDKQFFKKTGGDGRVGGMPNGGWGWTFFNNQQVIFLHLKVKKHKNFACSGH